MYLGFHVQYPDIFVRFSPSFCFLGVFSLSPKTLNFTEIRRMAASPYIRTDIVKVTCAFGDYANAPKMKARGGELQIYKIFSWAGNNDTKITNVATVLAPLDSDGCGTLKKIGNIYQPA
jgi:hypothetical protein